MLIFAALVKFNQDIYVPRRVSMHSFVYSTNNTAWGRDDHKTVVRKKNQLTPFVRKKTQLFSSVPFFSIARPPLLSASYSRLSAEVWGEINWDPSRLMTGWALARWPSHLCRCVGGDLGWLFDQVAGWQGAAVLGQNQAALVGNRCRQRQPSSRRPRPGADAVDS
jgi:hypothetical protein